MTEETLGYFQAPKNNNGITRSKTTLLLRSWFIDKTSKALEKINQTEWGELEFPSIYILFEKNKVWVGEAKSAYYRMKQHMASPDKKIKNWDRALVINDGRPATLSDLNDIVVRRAIEDYLNGLFKLNKYQVVSQASEYQLTSTQKTTVDNFIKELNYFLQKETLIKKLFPTVGQEEVHLDDLNKILKKEGKVIKEWSAHEAIIDGTNTFIRPGSNKKKGWQITFRDIFKDALEKGDGALLVPRGKILLIPFKEIQKVIKDPSKYNQNTIDIYIQFTDEGITLSYMDETIEISKYCLT